MQSLSNSYYTIFTFWDSKIAAEFKNFNIIEYPYDEIIIDRNFLMLSIRQSYNRERITKIAAAFDAAYRKGWAEGQKLPNKKMLVSF